MKKWSTSLMQRFKRLVLGLQAGPGEVDPPRPRADPPAPHPRWPPDLRHPVTWSAQTNRRESRVIAFRISEFTDGMFADWITRPGPGLILHASWRTRAPNFRLRSFMVRIDSEKHIDFALTSPFSQGGRPGRVRRKRLAAGGGAGDDDED